MSTPVFKNYDEILDDMMVALAAKGTKLTDLNPGSVTRTLLEIYAVKLDEAYFVLEQILNLFFGKTSTGAYLDRKVEEKSLTRVSGAKASGNLTAARSTEAPFSQLIPAGTVFETEDHTVQVETTADATMAQGELSVSIPVQALEVGASGNLQTGVTLQQVGVSINLVESVVIASPGLAGGADVESDTSLQDRYADAIQNPGTSGNTADYRSWGLEVAGVGGVDVSPLWAGSGTVKVFLLGADKTPAVQSVVDAAQLYIDPEPQGTGAGEAPVGATVTCVAATAVSINVAATVTCTGTKTLAEVLSSFETALTAYFKSIAFAAVEDDRTVRYSKICSLLLEMAGVTDYTALTVNGGTANVSITKGSVAVKGTVTLT